MQLHLLLNIEHLSLLTVNFVKQNNVKLNPKFIRFDDDQMQASSGLEITQ